MTKIQKTKRQKYGMNETFLAVIRNHKSQLLNMQHSKRYQHFKVNKYMHQFDCNFMNKSSFIILQQLESFYNLHICFVDLLHNFYAIYGMCIKVEIF